MDLVVFRIMGSLSAVRMNGKVFQGFGGETHRSRTESTPEDTFVGGEFITVS